MVLAQVSFQTGSSQEGMVLVRVSLPVELLTEGTVLVYVSFWIASLKAALQLGSA